MEWLSVPKLAHAAGAFIGLRVFDGVKYGGWTAEELVNNRGFTLVKWDGMYVLLLVLHPFVHALTQLMAAKASRWLIASGTLLPDASAFPRIRIGGSIAKMRTRPWTAL